MVWCGARNGRRATSDSPSGSTPATEWILVVSSASSRLILGRMVGMRRASMVLPLPRGPVLRVLLPAARTPGARVGEDGGDGAGRHGLAAPRGADHQDVVPAGRRHLEGALGVRLPF